MRYQGSALVRVVGVTLITTGVTSRAPRRAMAAAPRWNCGGCPGVVRVPSGKMISVWPCYRDSAASSSISALPLLLMYCAARIGPRVNGLSHRLCLTTQLASRISAISTTTSISEG